MKHEAVVISTVVRFILLVAYVFGFRASGLDVEELTTLLVAVWGAVEALIMFITRANVWSKRSVEKLTGVDIKMSETRLKNIR